MTTPKVPSLSLSLPPSMQQALPTAKPLYDIASIAQAAAGLMPVTTPKAKVATPAMLSVTPTKGGNLVRLDSSGLSSIAQEAASMMATMPITKPGAKSGSSVSVVPFTGAGVSTPTTPAAAAATAAASVDDGSILGLTSGASGGGGGDSPAPYQDPGPSQGTPDAPTPDDGGGYYDPTWDSNTTAVPASTAVLVASTATPSKVSAATTAAAPTAAATASKPIWTRIWQFLFGGKPAVAALPAAPAAPAAVVHGEPGSLEAECGSIIRRARLGDQNATALLVSTRENAARGSAKAKKSLAIMLKYIDSHPVDDSGAEIGGELDHAITYSGTEQVQHHAGVCDPVLGTAVSLSRGESLSNPRIERYLSQFGGKMQRAMIHGMLNPRRIPKGHVEPNLAKAHAVGRAIGTARRLQAVRAHGSTMTALDPVIGWECGE